MRVAIVINTSWNIFNFRFGLVKALLAQQHEVHAISPTDAYTPKLIDAGCKFTPIDIDNTGTNPLKDFALTSALYKVYKKINPDIILHFTIKPNIYGTIAAQLLGIPVINNVSGLGTIFLQKNIASNVAMPLYKLAFKFPKKVFFQNDDDCQLFIDLKLIKEDKTEILPGSGIDTEFFKPLKADDGRLFTFLIIARLIREKGILEYVEAAQLLKDKGIAAEFQILGAKAPNHKRKISPEKIDSWNNMGVIRYLGEVEDVRPIIRNADCVVLPSYREGTPRTLLEAASMGKPIVASDVPGCNHVVTDHFNGFLCRVKDVHDLAAKMEQMIEVGEKKRNWMGANSREKISKDYGEHIVIDKYLSAIAEILDHELVGNKAF